MRKPPPNETIVYRDGTDQSDHVFGQLKVHVFANTLGVERINVVEHSLFLIESEVVTNDVWEGVAERQHQWLKSDIIFLPGGTEVHAAYVSNVYKETMIRIPAHALYDAAKGGIKMDRDSLHYQGLPRQHVFGISQAVRNLAICEDRHHGFTMLAEAMNETLAIGVLYALAAGQDRPLHSMPNGLTPERRRRVLEFIESRLSSPMTLVEIANVAALSPFHFTRAFRREMGTTPLRYVWDRRARLAKVLMHDPSMTLVMVALSAGFANQSHFTTAFKAQTGMTPGAYRKSLN